jgi:hypothetical protein
MRFGMFLTRSRVAAWVGFFTFAKGLDERIVFRSARCLVLCAAEAIGFSTRASGSDVGVWWRRVTLVGGRHSHLHGLLDGIYYPPAHRLALSECVAPELVRLPVARCLQLQICRQSFETSHESDPAGYRCVLGVAGAAGGSGALFRSEVWRWRNRRARLRPLLPGVFPTAYARGEGWHCGATRPRCARFVGVYGNPIALDVDDSAGRAPAILRTGSAGSGARPGRCLQASGENPSSAQ